MELKEKYEKFNLPNFDQMNLDFELYDIDKDFFLPLQILRKISDKLEFLTLQFGKLLHPESIPNMAEYEHLTDQDHKDLNTLYSLIRYNYKRTLIPEIIYDEISVIELINEINQIWLNDIQKKSFYFFNKIKDAWKKANNETENIRYLG